MCQIKWRKHPFGLLETRCLYASPSQAITAALTPIESAQGFSIAGSRTIELYRPNRLHTWRVIF